jgi:hypothetical protein
MAFRISFSSTGSDKSNRWLLMALKFALATFPIVGHQLDSWKAKFHALETNVFTERMHPFDDVGCLISEGIATDVSVVSAVHAKRANRSDEFLALESSAVRAMVEDLVGAELAIQDSYWTYYGDCDHWDIVFSRCGGNQYDWSPEGMGCTFEISGPPVSSPETESTRLPPVRLRAERIGAAQCYGFFEDVGNCVTAAATGLSEWIDSVSRSVVTLAARWEFLMIENLELLCPSDSFANWDSPLQRATCLIRFK